MGEGGTFSRCVVTAAARSSRPMNICIGQFVFPGLLVAGVLPASLRTQVACCKLRIRPLPATGGGPRRK